MNSQPAASRTSHSSIVVAILRRAYRMKHPSSSTSLKSVGFTQPPLPVIELDVLGVYEVKVANPTGVTMWDVVYQIAEQ